MSDLIYRRDFRTEPFTLPIDKADLPWHAWGDENIEQDPKLGLRMWCRNGTDCGAMLDMPQTYGTWLIRSRITGPKDRPTTKDCNLLWPKQAPDDVVARYADEHHLSREGAKQALAIWPPELDMNESGLRMESHQTLHYGTREQNFMHHTSYDVDQTQWHTYATRVTPGRIDYLCDGAVRASVTQDVPDVVGWDGAGWNLHLRTETHDRPDVTEMDVRWIEIRSA